MNDFALALISESQLEEAPESQEIRLVSEGDLLTWMNFASRISNAVESGSSQVMMGSRVSIS